MPSNLSHAAALVLVAALAVTGLPEASNAQASKTASVAATLEGSWSGGGTVSFTSGATEQARCRARYSPAGRNSYTLNATCATPSGRAAQTATVRRVGEHKYSGVLQQRVFDLGVIHIVVRGASQSVRLVSDSGSAFFNLNR